MTGAVGHNQRHFPVFPSLPGKLELAAYGGREHEGALDAGLQRFDGFFVTDMKKKDHLRCVANGFISKRGYSIVRTFVCNRPDTDKALWQLKKLLSLGVDPDTPHPVSRPSHDCSFWAAKWVAEVLVKCRPNLKAKDWNGDTPEKVARKRSIQVDTDPDCHSSYTYMDRHLVVAGIWENAAREGFPTIAQMARDQDFWAVRNVVLRSLVPDSEKCKVFEGRTAVGWAQYHGQDDLAEELRFLLGGDPPFLPEPEPEEGAGMKEILAEMFWKVNEENAELKEKVESLKQGLGVQDQRIDWLKERIQKMDDNCQSLEAKLTAGLQALTVQMQLQLTERQEQNQDKDDLKSSKHQQCCEIL